MFVMISNTYMVDEVDGLTHVVTEIVGVFETREIFQKVWNDTLKNIGVPEEEFEEYQPGDIIGNTFVPIGSDRKYTENQDDAEWIIELGSKEIEMNKVLYPGD